MTASYSTNGIVFKDWKECEKPHVIAIWVLKKLTGIIS